MGLCKPFRSLSSVYFFFRGTLAHRCFVLVPAVVGLVCLVNAPPHAQSALSVQWADRQIPPSGPRQRSNRPLSPRTGLFGSHLGSGPEHWPTDSSKTSKSDWGSTTEPRHTMDVRIVANQQRPWEPGFGIVSLVLLSLAAALTLCHKPRRRHRSGTSTGNPLTRPNGVYVALAISSEEPDRSGDTGPQGKTASSVRKESPSESEALLWDRSRKTTDFSIWFEPSADGLGFRGVPRASCGFYRWFFTGDTQPTTGTTGLPEGDQYWDIAHANQCTPVFQQLNDEQVLRVDARAQASSSGQSLADVCTMAPGYHLNAGTVESMVALHPPGQGDGLASSANCGRLLRCAMQSLQCQGRREDMTVALTDCSQVIFIRCTRRSVVPPRGGGDCSADDGAWMVDCSRVYDLQDPDGTGNRLLRALLTTRSWHRANTSSAVAHEAIGFGTAATVYSIEGDASRVIKVFNSPAAAMVETTCLRELQGVPNVIQVHECSAMAAIISPNLATTAASALFAGGMMPCELAPLVFALQAMHRKGMVHRDIHLDNILLGTAPILIDFENACFFDDIPPHLPPDTQRFLGFMRDRAVPTLIPNFDPGPQNYWPGRDLHAFVEAVYEAVYFATSSTGHRVSPTDTTHGWVPRQWHDMRGQRFAEPPWAPMLSCAETLDYATLHDLVAGLCLRYNGPPKVPD